MLELIDQILKTLLETSLEKPKKANLKLDYHSYQRLCSELELQGSPVNQYNCVELYVLDIRFSIEVLPIFDEKSRHISISL